MNKAEVVYEFINQFAYFACSGIIFMENYTIADGNVFSDLIDDFDLIMEKYQELAKHVEEGRISEEAADSIIRASIKNLRSGSVIKFFELIKEDILPNSGECKERENAITAIMKGIKEYKVTNKEFIVLMETLRKEEEKQFKEATQ